MFSSEQIVELASNLKSLISPECRKHHLSFAQFLIISNIPASGISLKKLSVVVGSEISTMSRNIDKLIIQKLVIKSPDRIDRRKVLITLTKKSIILNKTIHKTIKALLVKLYANELDDDRSLTLKDELECLSWLCYKYLNEK